METNAATTEQLFSDFKKELEKLKPAVLVVSEMTDLVQKFHSEVEDVYAKAKEAIQVLENETLKNVKETGEALKDYHMRALKSLNDLKSAIEQFISELDRQHSALLEKIEHEIANLASSGVKSIQEVEEIAKRSIGEFGRRAENEFTAFVQKAEALLKDISNTAEELLTTFRETMEKVAAGIQTMLEEKVDALRDEIHKLVHGLPGILERLSKLVEYLEMANVPGRLDRIESGIASMNTSVQNLYARVDALERTVRDENAKVLNEAEALERRLNGLKTTTIILSSVQLAVLIGLLIWLILKA